MTAILEGVYKQGKIELLEVPEGVPEGRVRVILMPPAPLPPRPLTFGKYRAGRVSSLDDFRAAQWHGDEERDTPHGQ
jgi:hypothetical protein